MKLLVRTAPASLAPFVRTVIWYCGYSGSNPYELLMPDGTAQLIVPLEGPSRQVIAPFGRAQHHAVAYFTGLRSQPILYRSEQQASTLCIQFTPLGFRHFVGPGAATLVNQTEEVSSVSKAMASKINELAQHNSGEELMQITIAWLGQFFEQQAMDHAVAWACRLLENSSLSIADVVKQTGYSHRYFVQRFQNQIGFTPKKFQRLQRFNQALLSLRQAPKDPFDTIFRLGYFDQAHFSREFKSFSGVSPGKYIAHRPQYAHVLSLKSPLL
ncbi:MAG: helix-turn-helix transcriptional regulator [Salibacteraceae bacterium]